MDPMMILTAAEAQRDQYNARMHARTNPEPDTGPKFHVVTFRSRGKAVALREFALKEEIYFHIARRGAVFSRQDYDKNRIASVRRRFESWWRRADPRSR